MTVYNYLAALDITTGGVRACETCTMVFEALRALTCPSCRRSPVRATLRPWHTNVAPADRAAGARTATTVRSDGTLLVAINRRRGSTATVYTTDCVTCGASSPRPTREPDTAPTAQQAPPAAPAHEYGTAPNPDHGTRASPGCSHASPARPARWRIETVSTSATQCATRTP